MTCWPVPIGSRTRSSSPPTSVPGCTPTRSGGPSNASCPTRYGGGSKSGFNLATLCGRPLELRGQRVDSVAFFPQFALGHKLVPDALGMTRRWSDATNPRGLAAVAQARLVVQTHQLEPFLEGLVCVLAFFLGCHESTPR